jgi:hypothetical protein
MCQAADNALGTWRLVHGKKALRQRLFAVDE